SVEQLIGDTYGACMDQPRVDALGTKPIAPLLAEIDAIKDAAGVQKVIARLHDENVPVPFGVFAAPDNHHPASTIAYVVASGLALPDRDYYGKTEPRFAEAREKYHAHVTAMFKLAGASEADAKADADAVFDQEKALAEASLDNVALRDPQATDHKTTFA